jgi:histidinol-phosphate aminotransferase
MPNDPQQQATTAAHDAATAGDVAARVAATIRPEIRALSPYAVAKAGGMIKLDAMENPFRLPAEIGARIAAAVADVPVNRYPDGAADALKEALRDSLRLPADVALMLGNGSDELLQIVTTAVARPGAVVLSPEPSFVMYRLNAVYANARFVGVPLDAGFGLDAAAMLAAVERERPALVWLAYPNNPTGNRFDPAVIEWIVRTAPGLVVVDEAYYAYAAHSFLPRVLEFPNLLIVRTLSKIGMAGLRLGYAAGHPAWIAELEKVRPPYNVNALTQAVVPLLLQEDELLAAQAATIRAERERLGAALARIAGVEVFATETNFVVARVPDAQAWFAALRDAGILVKNLDGWHPLLAGCLRITVGTPAENDALLQVLDNRG